MPDTRSWSRCRAGAMCPRWPAAAAAPSPAAGTAPARCRCPIGTLRRRCVGGVAVRSPRCAVPDADPTRCARSSSAHAGPPKNSAGHFPASPSSPPAAIPWSVRCRGEPALVVATPGAEPVAAGGYGAALLLDAWALLGRQDLRAAEDTLRRWMAATTLGPQPRRRRCGRRGRRIGGADRAGADPMGPGRARRGRARRPRRGGPATGRAYGRRGRRTRRRGGAAGNRRVARLRRNFWDPSTCRPEPADLLAPRPQARSAECWCGCPAPMGWSWPRRCGGPPGCSARGTISSLFGCKSTRCT